MNLTRCENGHFYDVDKFPMGCPHCGTNGGSEITVSAKSLDIPEPVTVTQDNPTMPITPMGGEMDMTVGEVVRTPDITPTMPGPMAAPGGYQQAPVYPTPAVSPMMGADDGKTVRLNVQGNVNHGIEPVVGWLVCVSDSHYGESFKLKSGRNFIGRSVEMDVVLNRDNTVSRDRHAILLYEPKRRSFLVQPGESRELFYLNDDVVLTTEELKPYDILSIGQTQLVFIPFCTKTIAWDDFKSAER